MKSRLLSTIVAVVLVGSLGCQDDKPTAQDAAEIRRLAAEIQAEGETEKAKKAHDKSDNKKLANYKYVAAVLGDRYVSLCLLDKAHPEREPGIERAKEVEKMLRIQIDWTNIQDPQEELSLSNIDSNPEFDRVFKAIAEQHGGKVADCFDLAVRLILILPGSKDLELLSTQANDIYERCVGIGISKKDCTALFEVIKDKKDGAEIRRQALDLSDKFRNQLEEAAK